MEIGEAVINALFDHDLRAIKKSIRLGSRRSNKNFLTAKQDCRVRTIREIVQQLLEDCHLGPNDKLAEYITWS